MFYGCENVKGYATIYMIEVDTKKERYMDKINDPIDWEPQIIIYKCSKWKEWIQRCCHSLRHYHNRLRIMFTQTKLIGYIF